MNILIIRSYPSIVNLKSNSYNQQEIGLATAFLEKGHNAGIVYFGGDKHLDDTYLSSKGEIKIYYRKAKVILGKIALYEDFDDLKDSYDMLILNEYDQFETAKTLKKYAEKSIIYHGPYYAAFNKRYNMYNKLYDILYKGRIKKYAPVIFTKSKLAMEFLQQKGLQVKDYVGVGLDTTQLTQLEECANPFESSFNENCKYLLYVGRLEERRNTLFILECFKKLVEQSKEYRLILIGDGDEEYKQKVMDYISQNDLKEYILYKQRLEQKQLPYVYKNSHMFLLPTSYEIWGMVLMEAMLYNIPVITTYNGGSSSLIDNGINGKIIDDLDVDKWVEVILSANYNKTQLSEYNESIIKQKCNWTYIAQRMISEFLEERK